MGKGNRYSGHFVLRTGGVLAVLVAVGVMGSIAAGATIERNGSGDDSITQPGTPINQLDLNLAEGWIGGVVPGSDDVAHFWNTGTGPMPTSSLGADLAWEGIVVDVGQFNSGTVIANDGHTLTLGASGLTILRDRSVTFDNHFALSADQSWSNAAMAATKHAIFNGDLDLGSYSLILAGKGGKVINGAISGSGNLTVASQGNIVLRGINSYTGNTQLNQGNFILDNDAQLTFQIGADGVNNMITANGIGDNGTLNLLGGFLFDLSNASTDFGASWTIVDQIAMGDDLKTTYGESFRVIGFSVAGLTPGERIWTGSANGVTYAFTEIDGRLTVVPEPGALSLLGLGVVGMLRRRRICL